MGISHGNNIEIAISKNLEWERHRMTMISRNLAGTANVKTQSRSSLYWTKRNRSNALLSFFLKFYKQSGTLTG